jgi:hypothetical protein
MELAILIITLGVNILHARFIMVFFSSFYDFISYLKQSGHPPAEADGKG